MPSSVDFGGRPFHFIGVGGIGMSALAYILTKRGLPVSGSDLRLTHLTQQLQDAGAHIFWKQEAANLKYFQTTDRAFAPLTSAHVFQSQGVVAPISSSSTWKSSGRSPQLPQVICSTAIDTENPEYRAALALGCPVLHRSDVLAALIQEATGIAVAGTHGKTTTSSLMGYLLMQAGLDPTIVVGGEVEAWGGNARLGQSKYLVAEADESDGTLAKLTASIGVVTNIELDHPDHYQSLEAVVDIFRTFSHQCQTLVGCIDCATVRDSLQPDISYSLSSDSGADYIATEISFQPTKTTATILEKGQPLGTLELSLLGEHNLSNALAVVAVGRHIGLSFNTIAHALKPFQGARRRFELRGYQRGVYFIDDYAHHPSEIRATLSAARLKRRAYEEDGDVKRIIAVFQPHRYSRAATLLRDFADAFTDADQVLVTDIYSAGEVNHYGISGEQVADQIGRSHSNTEYCKTLTDVHQALLQKLQPGDLVLFLGAGNLNQIIPQVIAAYSESKPPSLEEVYR